MNKTSEFLKQCIADAYIQLLKENPKKKISADAIANRAGVGRATFFRYFRSREEIIVYKLETLWNTWAEEQNKSSHVNVEYQAALDFFTFNYSIRDLHTVIYAANLQHAIYSMLYKVMVDINTQDHLANYMNKFYAYGLFGILDEWVLSGYPETPEQLALFVSKQLVE